MYQYAPQLAEMATLCHETSPLEGIFRTAGEDLPCGPLVSLFARYGGCWVSVPLSPPLHPLSDYGWLWKKEHEDKT